MAKKSKKVVDTTGVRALSPRDPDTQYFGDEPIFATQPEADKRKYALANSLNWYSKFYGRKDAKGMLIQYLELNNRKDQARQINKANDDEFLLSLAWLARMTLRGLKLTEQENQTLENEISRLIKTVYKPEIKISKLGNKKVIEEKEPGNRPNVQEIMKEKAREAAGELEGIFDDFIKSGAPSKFATKAVDEVSKKNVLPQHVNIVLDIWKNKLNEFEMVVEGKDKQLVEGYGQFGKTQLKNIVKFIEQVIADLNSYVSVKKATKTPRKRKAVPVEKIVSKLKYLKEFKDPKMKLDLVSLHPVKLHGASECYLYDSAKRKLIYLCADEYSKSFTVKGTTILGFDSGKSQVKTIRKPGEQLKEFLKLGKPSGRKFFADIKAVATPFNGRTNENMLILKAW